MVEKATPCICETHHEPFNKNIWRSKASWLKYKQGYGCPYHLQVSVKPPRKTRHKPLRPNTEPPLSSTPRQNPIKRRAYSVVTNSIEPSQITKVSDDLSQRPLQKEIFLAFQNRKKQKNIPVKDNIMNSLQKHGKHII